MKLREKYVKCIFMFFWGLMSFWIFAQTYDTAVAATVLPTNVETASKGNTLVGVEGSFATDVKKAIKLVNKYRLEACKKGYPDPRNSNRKLITSDYVPIKWSSDLEYIARIRAAEASVYGSHTRPNGKSCFSIEAANGVSSCAEVLAWGGSTIVDSVTMWYGEKETWVKGEKGVTGHYTSMISPSNTYMGMANFDGTGAGEFTKESWVDKESVNLDTTPLPKAKNVIQTIEVGSDKLSALHVKVDSKFVLGSSSRIQLIYLYDKTTTLKYLGDIEWSCNSDKITLLSDGTITADKVGKHKITFTYSGNKNGNITKQITVIPKSPKIKKVIMGKTSAKIKFAKVSDVSGYEIRYIYGNMWYPKQKKIKVSKTVTVKQIKGLPRKSIFIVEIRSYKKVGEKIYYSAWSEQVFKNTK